MLTNDLTTKLLLEAGLDNNEIAIYLTLLERGELSYTQLARISKVKRTTCYAVIARLKQYNLVVENFGSPIVLVRAEPPSHLVSFLDKEQAQIFKRIELAKRAAQEISKNITPQQFTEPKLTYIPEDKIEDFLYKRTDEWDSSAHKHDSIIWGFEASAFEKQFGNYIAWYWERPAAQHMRIKFFGDDPHGRSPGTNPDGKSEFKYLGGTMNFQTNIWVYGDYILILSLQKTPHYIIEVHEPLLATNLRQFFQGLWNTIESSK